MRLKDKVALVTGATNGIGRASAILFAKEGAKVIVSGRNEERGNQVVETIKADGGEAFFIKADVTKNEDMDNLIDKTIETYGKVDIFFCNAGISISPPDFLEFTDEIYDAIMDTNMRAPFYMTRKILPYILESKGNILYTSSVSGVRPSSLAYIYGASKFALIGFMKALALDYAAKGIRFNALCPGVSQTAILDGVPEDTLNVLAAQIPMGRLGKPEDLAYAALYMVSDEASYLTGQTLIVDGGYLL